MYICIVDNQDLYTAGTAEIHACGDMNPVRDSAQEAYTYLDYGQFTNVGSIIYTTHIFLYAYYISYKKDKHILLNHQILSVKNALKK